MAKAIVSVRIQLTFISAGISSAAVVLNPVASTFDDILARWAPQWTVR